MNNVELELIESYNNNSEVELLSILKNNSFLFYELFRRKKGIQPIFHEVPLGVKYRCDFCWLKDRHLFARACIVQLGGGAPTKNE